MDNLKDKIVKIAKAKGIAIFAHTYQSPDIQEIADFTADSLELARKSRESESKIILLCGVHFMAESAAILAPDKIILIPDMKAGCPMADMVTEKELLEAKKKYPKAFVVTYVNSSAKIKALSDVCCTSANAVEVVRNFPAKEVLFVPDQFLGGWIKEQLKMEKIIHLYPGYCPVHQIFSENDVKRLKEDHSHAVTLCHPEANPVIRAHADKIMSTSQMIRYAAKSSADEFIILTETGIETPLKKNNPQKKFYFPDKDIVCKDMKKITLEKVLHACEKLEYRVTVPEEVRTRAFKALDKMLKYG
jgi:quinolinate synthase